MKRFLSILLTLAMLIPLAACAGGTEDSQKDTDTGNTPETKASNAIEYEADGLPALDFEGTKVVVLMSAIIKAKPAAAKGQYIKSCVVASTMGPGIRVNSAKRG